MAGIMYGAILNAVNETMDNYNNKIRCISCVRGLAFESPISYISLNHGCYWDIFKHNYK